MSWGCVGAAGELVGGLLSLGSLLFGGPLLALQAAASAFLSARAFLAASFSLKVVSSRGAPEGALALGPY